MSLYSTPDSQSDATSEGTSNTSASGKGRSKVFLVIGLVVVVGLAIVFSVAMVKNDRADTEKGIVMAAKNTYTTLIAYGESPASERDAALKRLSEVSKKDVTIVIQGDGTVLVTPTASEFVQDTVRFTPDPSTYYRCLTESRLHKPFCDSRNP